VTTAKVLSGWCRYLRADVCGLSAAELGELAGVSSSAILRMEDGAGPSRRVLEVLLGIRAQRGVQGAIDAWSFDELVDHARRTADRLSAPRRAA
jgi:hypothetical protein